MKMKKKGKVYPSPNHSFNEEEDSLSVLKLLPTTILVLVSVLSLEDREVLAYLITRGTTINPSSSSKKNKSSRNHKPPIFDCECFDCYTNYWFRWDSSTNRELIHQIIEAFEEHQIVINGENSSSSSSNNNNNKSKRGKKKEKVTPPPPPPPPRRVLEVDEPVTVTTTTVLESEYVSSPDKFSEADVEEREPEDEVEETTVDLPVNGTSGHKGLARKVLPDVLGLFNSNFWRLWNPNA